MIVDWPDATITHVRADLQHLGLRYRTPNSRQDKAAMKRKKAAENGAARVADRRRFKTVAVPYGQP